MLLESLLKWSFQFQLSSTKCPSVLSLTPCWSSTLQCYDAKSPNLQPPTQKFSRGSEATSSFIPQPKEVSQKPWYNSKCKIQIFFLLLSCCVATSATTTLWKLYGWDSLSKSRHFCSPYISHLSFRQQMENMFSGRLPLRFTV